MEDPRENVIKTLEANGTLDYIKAQLRSKVYTVLNDQNQHLQKPETHKVMETELGQISAELIRDFMEYFALNCTLNIFIPECHLPSKKKELTYIESKLKIRASHEKPILFTILEKLMTEPISFSRPATSSTSDSYSSTSKPISQPAPLKPIPKPAFEDPPKSSDSKPILSKPSEPIKEPSKLSPDTSKLAPEVSAPSSRVDLTKLAPLKPANKSLPSLDLGKKAPAANARSTFSDIDAQLGDLSSHIESSIEESIEIEEESLTNRDHEAYESYGASSSLGVDASVNSEVIENYDYVEDIRIKR